MGVLVNGIQIQAGLFDMDGTLIDCEPVNRAAVQSAAGKSHTINWAECAGKKESIIHDWLRAQYKGFNVEKDPFVANCKQGYVDRYDELRAREGIHYLLKALQSAKLPLAVVTNTEEEMAKKKLEKCGLSEYFQFVVGSDTMEKMGRRAKPSGDPYRYAASLFGLLPSECMITEDVTTGIDAAVDAEGSMIVHIFDHGTPKDSRAHIHVNGRNPHELVWLANSVTIGPYLSVAPQPGGPAYAR